MCGIRITCASADERFGTDGRLNGSSHRYHKNRVATHLRVGMDDYRVVMEAAWQVRDVETPEDAIGIAVSEAGRRLNDQDLPYVDVAVGFTTCPSCDEAFDAALVAAQTAMVGLLCKMDVFNAEDEEHAGRIARSEVGGALRDVPLEVVEVEPVTEEAEDGVDAA